MEPRRVTIPYKPRPHQLLIHNSVRRWNVLVCHRRFGKTVLVINHIIRAALTSQLERPRYAYLAPLLKQAKAIVWDYLKFYTREIPGTEYNEAELRCDLPNGARIQLLGADNPDAIRGIYLDGVGLDEYAQMSPRVFPEIIRPTLSDRTGWAIFMGTPFGKNHFFDLWKKHQANPDWYCAMFKASDTGIVNPLELIDARKMMTEDEYDQEYECSFAAGMQGAYYAKQIADAEAQRRICPVPWDPNLPVYTIWDLGVNDATSIGFVQEDNRLRCYRWIDYLEDNGQGAEYYAKRLKEKPYAYGFHLLPHDVEVQEWTPGLTRKAFLNSIGIRPIHVVKKLLIVDGIDAARRVLPVCYFDEEKTEGLYEGLRSYRKEYDADNKVFRNRPLHDWSSNPADMFRYFASGFKTAQRDSNVVQMQRTPKAEMEFDPMRWQPRVANTTFDPWRG